MLGVYVTYHTAMVASTVCPKETKLQFGPFDSRTMAEQCLIILAGRSDVRSATIVPWKD